MQRGDKSRFCSECKTAVHDLSAMTKREAADLLAAPENASLCVRYLHDEMGHMLFVDTYRDRPIPMVALLRKRVTQAAAVAALGMSLTACMGARARPAMAPVKPTPVEQAKPTEQPAPSPENTPTGTPADTAPASPQ